MSAGDGGTISRELLLACLGASTDFIFAISPDRRILFVNRYASGFAPENVIGQDMLSFLEPCSRAAALACLERVQRTQQPDSYESMAMGADRALTYYETRVAPLVRDGEVVAMMLVATDIGQRKRTELALREGQERLRLAVGATRLGLWSWEPAQDTIIWDERMHEIFGVPPGRGPRTIGEYTAMLHPEDHAALRRRSTAAATQGKVQVSEQRIVRPSGEVRWIRVQGQAIARSDGGVEKIVGATLDITDERALEERLRQSQKIEALGQLTAGIAHNFNNLLTVILAGLDLATRRSGAVGREALADTQRAAERAGDLVRDLLLFTGQRSASARRVQPLAPLLARTDAMCRATFDRQITIKTFVAPDAPEVDIDAGQLEQVLLNLCLNARDALQGAPTRSVELSLSRVPAAAVPGHPGAANAPPYACVEVRDSGSGMNEATRARVFEPFFTTKPPGQGTGLGLATAYAIVRDHGGILLCDSVEGAGSTFRVLLPEAPPPPTEAAPSPAAAVPRPGRILLVDDEPAIRRFVAAVLEDEGHELTTAEGVSEGLARFDSAAAPFDLVLLDVTLRDGSGRDLARRIRERRPAQRVAFFSGNACPDDLDGHAILQKPVAREALLRGVRALLDRP